MKTQTRRKVAQTLLLMMAFTLMMMFALPVTAHATTPAPSASAATGVNDPNNMNVNVDEDGNMTVTIGGFNAAEGSSGAWNNFISKYRKFISGFAGIGAVTMIVLFIMQFLKLGASAGNPNARSQALAGCLWTGISAMLLGSVTFIVGFFYNALM